MPFPVWAWFLISLVVSVALAPKPPRPRPAALEDFDIPTAELDRPLPVLFGTKRITGPNVTWYGALETQKIKQRQLFSSQTVGFRYFMGLQLGLCHGPIDELSKIEAGEKEVWTGSLTANGSIDINLPELFGGDKREGGMVGRFDVQFGELTQQPHAWLETKVGGPLPAFRGMFGVVWRRYLGIIAGEGGGYVGNSPYLKPWAFTCKRITAGWFGGDAWYPAKAEIAGVGMNPAHIVYQALTDPRWGMGSPIASINDEAFKAVADQLHDEGFGLNLLWNQATTVDQFLQIVLDHIGGVLAFDRVNNQYVLKLVRGDYDVDELEVFDESTISSLDNLQATAWGETVNELTVTYTDPDTLQATPITLQDLANVRAQQAVISEQVDFSGIHSHSLIRDVAARELKQRSTPLRQGRMTVDRNFWSHTIGDVFKLTWQARNLSEVVMRVISIDEGTLERGAIGVDFIEDIYALEGFEYSQVQTPPDEPPEPTPPDVDDTNPNVLGRQSGTPPDNPQDGDRYYIPSDPAPSGDWAGHAGQIAEWDEGAGAWVFIDVPEGIVLYDEGAEQHFVTNGSGLATVVGFTGAGATGGAAGGFAVDQSYLWYIKTNQGTEIVPGAGPVPGWTFERRLRFHGFVVDVMYTGGGLGVGELSWQYHFFDALTGERIGSSNAGGRLVDVVHEGLGARYWYQVGDTGTAGDPPTVRKLDSQAGTLGGTISGLTAEVYQDATVEAFLGLAKIGDLLYLSIEDTSSHLIRTLDADTLAVVNEWSYSGDARPGRLVTNGADLWAIDAALGFDADAGLAHKINLSTGAIEFTIEVDDYVRALDAELVLNPQSGNWELWIAHGAEVGEHDPTLVRYQTGGGGSVLGTFDGSEVVTASAAYWVHLTRDGDLLSYGVGSAVNPIVFDVSTQAWEQLEPPDRGPKHPGYYTSPNIRALDLLEDHDAPETIVAARTFVPIYEEDNGRTRRLPLSELGGTSSGGTAAQAGVRLFRSNDFEVAASTPTPIVWQTADFDDEGFWPNGSEDSQVAALSAGKYLVTANVQWDASTDGERVLSIRVNGAATVASTRAPASSGLAQQLATLVELDLDDYVEVVVESTAAAAVDLDAAAALPHMTLSRYSSAVVSTQLRGATWVRQGQAVQVPANDVALYFPKAARIFGVTVFGHDVSGSCEVDIWKGTLASIPNVADSICGGNLPAISSARSYNDTDLTGWQTLVEAGSLLLCHLNSNTNFKQIFLQLHIREAEE